MSKNLLKYIIPLASLLLFLGISSEVNGQSNQAEPSKKTNVENSKAKQEMVYDTQETLSYFGGRMAYQLKKKLHLTDVEDEKNEEKEKKAAQKAKFTIFGLKVEKH